MVRVDPSWRRSCCRSHHSVPCITQRLCVHTCRHEQAALCVQLCEALCVLQGLMAALVGLVSDPVAGFRKASVQGLVVGGAKGIIGLGLRPLGGFSEACSKSSQGFALVCLGRQGIQGRTMRRVYNPGTTRRLHEQQEVRCWPRKCRTQALHAAAASRAMLHCVGRAALAPGVRV
jgi:hypothetical protein